MKKCNTNIPFFIVIDKKLSTNTDPRYVIINKATNEVVDNAEGYGYSSFKKALRCAKYKKLHDMNFLKKDR